jgi:hypothetical protein
MNELNEILRKQYIRYRMRMRYLEIRLRWRVKFPWEM